MTHIRACLYGSLFTFSFWNIWHQVSGQCGPSGTGTWVDLPNRDSPTANGDFEIITDKIICDPGLERVDIQCVENTTNIDYNDFVFDDDVAFHYCDLERGFVCRNSRYTFSPECPDFRVRVCCDTVASNLNPWLFVIDDTGSMSQEIGAVRNTIAAMLQELEEDNDDFPEYYILSQFDDPNEGTGGVIAASYKTDDAVKAAVNGIDANGGGDCPEYSLSGINEALDCPGCADKVVDSAESNTGQVEADMFLFTDADTNVNDPYYGAYAALRTKLDKYGIRVHALLTGYCGAEAGISVDGISTEYVEMTALSGGLFIATSDAEIESTVAVIDNFLIKEAVGLSYVDTDASSFESSPFPLNSNDGSLTVVASGGFNSFPSVTLSYKGTTDPDTSYVTYPTTGYTSEIVGNGFRQISIEIDSIPASIDLSDTVWKINAMFTNARRRRRLQTAGVAGSNRVISYLTDTEISFSFEVSRVDGVTGDLERVNTYLYCQSGESFRVSVEPTTQATDDVTSVDQIVLYSRDGTNSVTSTSVVSSSNEYYADFNCDDVTAIASTGGGFRISVEGSDSDTNKFQRSYDFVVQLTDILLSIECDNEGESFNVIGDRNDDGYGSLECDITVDINSNNNDISVVSIAVTLENESLFGDYVDISLDDASINAPGSTKVTFTVDCAPPQILGSIFNAIITVTSNTDAITSIEEPFIIVSPINDEDIPFDYSATVYCDGDICDCDDNVDCKICHSNGCDQCENGFFQKSAYYLCQSCTDTFGDACLVCNDDFGCSQCTQNYDLLYDECSDLWYCKEKESITNTGNGETGGIDYGDFICPNDCGNDNCNCVNCNSNVLTNCENNNGFCPQCQSGYWKKSNNHNCVSCNAFFGDGCMFCQDYNGCGQCKAGYTRTFDNTFGCNVWYCKPN